LIKKINIPDGYIEKEAAKVNREIKRRLLKYRGNINSPDLSNKRIILTDDGIATGYTMLAAIESIKKKAIRELILAIGVAPKEVLSIFKDKTDKIEVLISPKIFYAVGQYYRNFPQISDNEVIKLLKRSLRY
jgi:putative phosphoribosyl transferase